MKTMHSIGANTRARGLTLVELMVALVMGLILLAGLATVFVANKQTYRYQETLATLQENGRFALAMLERDIRSAGGGIDLNAQLAYNNVSLPGVKSTDPACGSGAGSPFGGVLEGYDATENLDRIKALGPPFNDSSWVARLNPDSDVIRVVTSGELGVDIAKDPGFPGESNPAARLEVTGCDVLLSIHETSPGTVFTVVTEDGAFYSVFQLTDVPTCAADGTGNISIRKNNLIEGSGVWNCDFRLKENYTGGYLVGTQSAMYFVANTTRQDAGGNSVPALYRSVNAGAPQEVVEGVESMRLMFGTGTDRVTVDYEEPEDIWTAGDWETVRSVRLQLLLRSLQPNTLPKANPVQFDPTDFFPDGGIWSFAPDDDPTTNDDDGRWRQVYSTTIALRNRLP